MSVLAESFLVEPESRAGADKAMRLVRMMAWLRWCEDRAQAINKDSAVAWGVSEPIKSRGHRDEGGARKRWDRDIGDLRSIGCGMVWDGEANMYRVRWASAPLLPGSPGALHEVRACVLIVARLRCGVAGMDELAQMVGMEAEDVLGLIRRLGMVGRPPYLPHDYFGFERCGGVVEMFTGPPIWGRDRSTVSHYMGGE